MTEGRTFLYGGWENGSDCPVATAIKSKGEAFDPKYVADPLKTMALAYDDAVQHLIAERDDVPLHRVKAADEIPEYIACEAWHMAIEDVKANDRYVASRGRDIAEQLGWTDE